MTSVLVTGGTGMFGRDVVKQLRESGHSARVFSRQPGPREDWAQGDRRRAGPRPGRDGRGHPRRVGGARAVEDPRDRRRGTRKLLTAAAHANIKHVVYISIVGIEGVAYPYYRDKLAAEDIVRETSRHGRYFARRSSTP